jgi:hypothetical protein
MRKEPKRRLTLNRLRGVISQKMALFNVMEVNETKPGKV